MLPEETFQADCERIRPGLQRFVASRIRDTHAALDVVQEVYTKAFRNRERFDESRSFTTWIYAIARNACIDFLRRRLRDPLAGVAPNAPASPPDLDHLPHGAPGDPVAAAERRDLMEFVRRELRRLPDHRRAVVEMKIVEGLTYREIAAALDVPLGTVAFWVKEALETVARRLRDLR
ncbi:MAG: RNA polymerase sigma factor [Planctomycetaceae bacterium]